MFNRSNNSGSNAGGRSDKTNSGNDSSFQRRSASNNVYHNLANSPALVHGAAGLIAAPSQTSQHRQHPLSLAAQSQALAQHQHHSSSLAAQTQALAQQQQRLLQMTKTENEVQQMASNIKESLLIKHRLESIQQQEEANKIKVELHMEAAAQQVTANGIGGWNRNIISSSNHGLVSSAIKPIPSTSNSSVLPTKQREDEMTKLDLSTLAETAVAVASATTPANAHSRSSSGIMGIGSIIKMNSNNNTGNYQIAALLGRQASSSASSKRGLPTSQSLPTSMASSISNNAMTDALRRDLNATRDSLHLQHNYKRSLDEMTKSNTTTAPSSSSWLWKSATFGNTTPISMDQLRAQREQIQRRNSLPATVSSLSSELGSLRSLKRQRLLQQKNSEIGELELHDAMTQMQMRQLDANVNMHMTSNSSLLAEMASKMASQERRASLASSIASVGTSATASNFTSNSSFSSPVNRTNLIMIDSNFDERSKVLKKLNKMSGGFPMPKFLKSSNVVEDVNIASGGINSMIPAEITPELAKDVVNIMGRGITSLSWQRQLENDQQSKYLERIGGFPMPPLYRHNDESHVNNSSRNETALMARDQYDGTVNMNDLSTRSNNAISSHIRNNVNRSCTKAYCPPALESYKRVWRDIPVMAGVDPRVDERLRKEVFARKLQRGEILVGKTENSIMNNINNHIVNRYVQQRRLSELSHGSVSGNTSNNGRQTNRGTPSEESIVI